MSPKKKTARKPTKKKTSAAKTSRPARPKTASGKSARKAAAKASSGKKAAKAPKKKAAAGKAAPKPVKTKSKKAPAPAAAAASEAGARKAEGEAQPRARKKATAKARARVVPDIVKPGLGGKWECYACSAKFYDLGKPDPICPKCGADQRDKPRERVTPPPAEKARRPAVAPMTRLLDEEDEAVPDDDGEEQELGSLEDADFLGDDAGDDDDIVDVHVIED